MESWICSMKFNDMKLDLGMNGLKIGHYEWGLFKVCKLISLQIVVVRNTSFTIQ